MKRFALLMLLCGSANAEFWTGNQLLAKMQDNSVVERSFAMGYVSGVSDALTGIVVCAPNGVTVGQATDLTRSMLEANPADRHKSADIFVRAALVAVWPCQQKKGNPV